MKLQSDLNNIFCNRMEIILDFSTLTLFHFMDSIRMKLKIYFTVYVQTIFNNVENLRFENLI